ncbi:MAG TPA: O-antigen ligase family protein [Candidatus Binatia bacterium]|nr:O-antigen ligase family protein [Candidatus Binatia bacterium]
MLTILLVLSLLIWFVVFLQQIGRHGFLVLLLWLLVAPVALNIIERPGSNPFVASEKQVLKSPTATSGGYFSNEASIKAKDWLDPTRILLGAFVLFALVDPLLKKKRLVTLDKTELWMVAFGAILIASVLLDTRRTAFGFRVAIDAFIVPFMAYFVSRRLITSETRFRQLGLIIAATGFYVIVIALLERLLLRQGLVAVVQGPFESRDLLYIVVATAFFMALPDQLRDGGFFTKRHLMDRMQQCVICLTPLIILMTWRRGLWLGFISGVLLFSVLVRRFTSYSRQLAIIGLLLLLTPVVFMMTQASIFQETVGARLGRENTVYSRFGAWTITIEEGLKRPFLGIGLNNLRDVLVHTRTKIAGVKSETHSHNSFLAFFAELGTVGLLAYLMVVGTLFLKGWALYRRSTAPRDRWLGISVIAILAAYLVPALTGSVLHYPSVTHVYVFSYFGAITGICGRHLYGRRRNPPSVQSAHLAMIRSRMKSLQPARYPVA